MTELAIAQEFVPFNEVIENGLNAWNRIKNNGKKLREDWLTLASALDVGRQENTTEKGTLNKKGFGQWCESQGFGELSRQDRGSALWLLDNWESNDRLSVIKTEDNLNHPIAIQKAVKAIPRIPR